MSFQTVHNHQEGVVYRHEVDLHFFMTDGERALNHAAVRKAVEAAFERIERSANRSSAR